MIGRPALVLALLFAAACERGPGDPPIAAPAQPRAALLLEPPRVAVGEVADVILAVVTAPGWSVRPVPPPSGLRGLAWIEREALPPIEEPARRIHRTRLRVRAVEVGPLEFPGGVVQAVSPEGETRTLRYEPLPLEVASSLADTPARRVPYGVRQLPRSAAGRGDLALAFVAGASLALASVGLVALARRRWAAPVEPAPPPAARPPWDDARAALGSARDGVLRDPQASLDAAAHALRRYVEQRYGGDASVRTTPELRRAKPPFAMTTRWLRFVELLAELDALRFRDPGGEVDEVEAQRLLAAALAFVEETTPVEAG